MPTWETCITNTVRHTQVKAQKSSRLLEEGPVEAHGACSGTIGAYVSGLGSDALSVNWRGTPLRWSTWEGAGEAAAAGAAGRRRRGGGPRPHPRRRGDRLCRGRCRLCSSRPGGCADSVAAGPGADAASVAAGPGAGAPSGLGREKAATGPPAAGAWAGEVSGARKRKRRTADARRRRGHRCGGASYCSCGRDCGSYRWGGLCRYSCHGGNCGARLGAPATAAAGATTGASAGADSAAAADAGAITGAKLGAAAGAAAGALTGAVTGANPTAAAAAGAVAAAGAGAAAAASGAAAGAAAGAVAALTAGA